MNLDMQEASNHLDVLAAADTAHDAASHDDQQLNGWEPFGGSADADIVPELETITARSRSLDQNNGIAHGVLNTQIDNVIGSVLKLSANIDYLALGWSKEKARDWNKKTESLFRSFAESTECDAARKMNLIGKARQSLYASLLNGDAITLPLWIERNGDQWSTKLQNVESDRLSTPLNLLNKKNLSGGIQTDRYGAPTGYWIKKTHPGDIYKVWSSLSNTQDFQRIPAFTKWGRKRVIHFYEEERCGQSRGKSLFTSVIKSFKMAGMGIDYQMQTTIVDSLVSAFIESDLPDEVLAKSFGSEPDKKWNNLNNKNRVELKGGTIPVLPFGAKLNSFTPSRANGSFEPFMKLVLKHIAAGTNLSYELLMKDFSDTNYSSARATLLEVWRYFLSKRASFIQGWLHPVYELWLEEAVNAGKVEAPDFYTNKYAYSRSRWIMSGRGWVDPVKEAKGAQIRMDSGLSTMEKEHADQGQDWEEVLDQLELEKMELESRGLLDYVNKNSELAYLEPAEVKEDSSDEEDDNDNTEDDFVNKKQRLDSIGVAVRAGSITPQEDDEPVIRELLDLPKASKEVEALWKEQKGVRRPLTIKDLEEKQQPQKTPEGEEE